LWLIQHLLHPAQLQLQLLVHSLVQRVHSQRSQALLLSFREILSLKRPAVTDNRKKRIPVRVAKHS
jgi:hypothetical protein